MSQNTIISIESVLIAEMRALETQFQLPLFNPEAKVLRQNTEVALGKVYWEIMALKTKNAPKSRWVTRTRAGRWLVMPEHLAFKTHKLADEYIKTLKQKIIQKL